jgi:serine/threonine protein kinase/Tol biopolymer transport system component
VAAERPHWAAIERLYHAALALPVDERATLLSMECGDDVELRREVESLLAHHGSADDVLTRGAVAAAAGLVSDVGRSMVVGRRFGVYQVLAPIGAGGMGEVYRARDTRLGRDVAIKIVPHEFTSLPDRLARCEREARMLAALNHPHIAAIYGIEDDEGIHALVLELVDGETLAERIARGPLPVVHALEIARQIADALDAAHEKGIVHRDLKPANIKITSDGVVKVLDFGLAKLEAPVTEAGISASPTVTVGGTHAGLIVGTAAYMSPEQARGLPVDKRTDIWAFGCVLYEMLTGRAVFARDTISDTLAAVLEREPDWTALPRQTSSRVRRTLQRCLEKDPKRRLRDIADATAELYETAAGETPPVAIGLHRGYGATLAAIVVAGLAFSVWSWRTSRESDQATQTVTRTTIVLPDNQGLAGTGSAYPLALSADGRRLAYVVEQDGQPMLYVRELAALEARLIPGTAGARHPFFSPNGEWLGFFADGALQKVAVAGGVPLRICSAPGESLGGTWSANDTIVWASRGSGLMSVSAGGGMPQPVGDSAPAAWPEILPDGNTILFTTGTVAGNPNAIAAISLDGAGKRIIARTTDSSLPGPPVLGPGGGLAEVRFVQNGGYLVYGQDRNPGEVRALPVDPVSLTATGPAFSLVDSVERGSGGGAVYFAVSRTGLLLYAVTGDRHQLVSVDRNGVAIPISTDRAAFRAPRFSPDGSRIVVAINDETRRSDIWIYDAERGTRRRLTSERHNLAPVWTPDGRRIAFADGRLVTLPADATGPRELLFSSEENQTHLPAGTSPYPTSWSADGRDLLFQADALDLWLLSRDAGTTSHPLLERQFNDYNGQFSPDGKWVAYTSDESGREEVYVRHYPDFGNPFVISTDGGDEARWSHDGREIFFRQHDALMAVSVDTNGSFRAEKPRRLFAGRFTGAGRDPSFDISPDGKRFVMVKSDEASALTKLTVVQNWFDDLKRRAPAPSK